MSVRIGIRMSTAALVMTAALVGTLAGCTEASTSQGPGGDVPYVAPSANASAAAARIDKDAADAAEKENAEEQAALDAGARTPADVPDAFAGLQATYQDGCAPGDANCAYFLGRVNDELTGLGASMRADNDGPRHFKDPLAWIGALHTTLAGDTSTADLEKHRKELLGTRDRINTWMQGHPEDYR